MDQQNQNPQNAPLTPEQIARLEAQAADALRKGQDAPQPPADAVEAPANPDFVPYVDDVPPSAAPTEDATLADDDGEYIPSPWEKRIDALTPGQWKLCQIVAGAAIGVAIIASLFLFGEELALYGIVVAVLLALLLPRYLERAWRRKLNTARIAMAISMAICIAVMAVVIATTTGFKAGG